MSHWNYRVVTRQGVNGDPLYGVTEVYYDDAGKPNMWVGEPETGWYDTLGDLVESLENMLEDISKGRPVLREEDLPGYEAKQFLLEGTEEF